MISPCNAQVIASGSKELAFGSAPSGAKPSGTEAGRDPEGKPKDGAELDGETQGDDDDDDDEGVRQPEPALNVDDAD